MLSRRDLGSKKKKDQTTVETSALLLTVSFLRISRRGTKPRLFLEFDLNQPSRYWLLCYELRTFSGIGVISRHFLRLDFAGD